MNWMDGWWAYAFIAIAGWLATDIWRWLGVLAGNRLRDDSEALNWVRAVATALVAAVIAKLILYPTGVLAQSPLWLRLGAVAVGAIAFFPRPPEARCRHRDGSRCLGRRPLVAGVLRD